MADYGFDGLGEQRAATPPAAQLTPICDALCRAAGRGVPDAIGRQRFAIGFDRTGQAATHEALQFGEVCQSTTVLFLFFAVSHRRCLPPLSTGGSTSRAMAGSSEAVSAGFKGVGEIARLQVGPPAQPTGRRPAGMG